jgi:hypothetical protein
LFGDIAILANVYNLLEEIEMRYTIEIFYSEEDDEQFLNNHRRSPKRDRSFHRTLARNG